MSLPRGRVPRTICLVLVGLLAVAPTLDAHESRPAFLQIREVAPGRYAVLWRTPTLSGARLPVVLRFPKSVHNVTEPTVQELTDSRLERWVIAADTAGHGGLRVDFVGLQATITDVLVRVQTLDGHATTTLVHPSRPWIDIDASLGRRAMAISYFTYGVQHILFGIDHLLFVLGLLLLVRGVGPLLKTITAFTLAHSITLALATLDVVRLPPPPVEAAVALSIVFLASELVKQQRGVVGLAQRYPWVIAFAFGLLHGFGFAGTLTRIGIPSNDVPLALLMFNLGVEVGQLGFVAVFLLFVHSIRSLQIRWPKWSRPIPAYTIGSFAAFWVIQRVLGFTS